LDAPTRREQQVVVFIEVVDGAEVEPRAVISINRLGALMEYFSGHREFVSDLSLEQPAKKPIILIAGTAPVDPITAASIGGPIAKALLNPHREKREHVACPESAVCVAGRQNNLRKYRSLRSPTVTVLVDEPILETNWRVAVSDLRRAAGRTVERCYSVNRELAIGNETVIKFYARQSPSRVAAHDCAG